MARPSEKTPLQREGGDRLQRGTGPPPSPFFGPPSDRGYSPQAVATGESHEGVGLPPDPALVVAVLPRALPEWGEVAELAGPCPCPWVPSCLLLCRQLPPSPASPGARTPELVALGFAAPHPWGAPGTHGTSARGKAGSVCQSILGITHHQHPHEMHPHIPHQGSTLMLGLGTPGAGGASQDHPGGDAELLVATPGFLLELQICHCDPRAGTARRGTQLTVLWLLLLPVPTCRST